MTDTKPWYRQFWPWFVIALPFSSVVAGLSTVYIAFSNADSLIEDNWYQVGKTINRQTAKEQRAQHLNIGGMLTVETRADTPIFKLALNANEESPAPFLRLKWVHPTLSEYDQELTLTRDADGSYIGAWAELPQAHYHVQLESMNDDAPWRIAKRVHWPSAERIALGALDG